MPGGLSEPLGLLAFPAIKFAGYTAFAIYLNRKFPDKPRNIFLVGVSRMLLGLAFGTALAFLSFPFVIVFGVGLLIYVLGLIPVRIFEWWLLIKGFYSPREPLKFAEVKDSVILGVVTSFVLDIPALFGLVYAADFWIC
ncbi:MAG TPA: hypothetical protein PKD24_00480 [Pyrinomonadaceae bacterium]|nr:hypothetical protein [Pyrinomonadaceae bacterium]HMP64369.1 hypothetical protein [Pyrinomonadaceae bacterium]